MGTAVSGTHIVMVQASLDLMVRHWNLYCATHILGTCRQSSVVQRTKVVSCKSGMLVLFVDWRSDLLVACLLIECVFGLLEKFSTIFKKSCLS